MYLLHCRVCCDVSIAHCGDCGHGKVQRHHPLPDVRVIGQICPAWSTHSAMVKSLLIRTHMSMSLLEPSTACSNRAVLVHTCTSKFKCTGLLTLKWSALHFLCC